MTDAEIRAIRERKAETIYTVYRGSKNIMPPHWDDLPAETKEMIRFIVADSRYDVPALCDAVEEARKELRELADLMRKHGAFTEASEKAIRHALGGE